MYDSIHFSVRGYRLRPVSQAAGAARVAPAYTVVGAEGEPLSRWSSKGLLNYLPRRCANLALSNNALPLRGRT
ncbi:hypothetical protein EVAR_96718_1 [Eumeta japonica]|uniref:Uncharacterized protein n=1 Tax=Eumeta variegata TaxID=151549 RepID=A0A4C1WH36_EUMVA|nr:hypothetical protein EVAR_96718_1 [Eumeta japonica]